jgi:hypothetical protein
MAERRTTNPAATESAMTTTATKPAPTVFDTPPRLYDHRTTRDVFCSPSWEKPAEPGDRYRQPQGGCNSHVLLAAPDGMWTREGEHFLLNGQKVYLVSIHLHGGNSAIRWGINPRRVRETQAYIDADPAYCNTPWHNSDGIESWQAFRHFGLTLPAA